MFPWYQDTAINFQLPDDDKHGIQQLYGSKEDRLWAKIPTYSPKPNWSDYPRYKPTKPTRHSTTTTAKPPINRIPPRQPGKPDTCNTAYDAITVIRGEVFIFKDKYLWRIGDRGLLPGYPAEINRLWYGLPKNLTHVDAVYERNDKKIVFFIGRYYYLFDANNVMPGYPKLLSHLGLPRDLSHIDASMVWGHNSKTYFFSGTMYWRFDEDVKKVELDYPRDMSMWRGVGYNIDTVFQWKDGATYFFKGKGFWKFNDLRMRVENERQMDSASFWMGCPRSPIIEATEETFIPRVLPTSRAINGGDLPHTSHSSTRLISFATIIISIILLLVLH